MEFRILFIALGSVPAFACAALAGTSSSEVGALSCVTDKWTEKELAKGHKVADWVGRCVVVPDDPAHPKYTEECTVKYEYLPDESWKAAGTCTYLFPSGDKIYDSIEEGSHLKPSVYKITGGTGKYKGASGGGTYSCDTLTETLCGGRYKGEIVLP